jgi:hypothetical protein
MMAWIKEKHEQEQQEKWENLTTTIKERKKHHIMNTNTKTMTIREQVVISRLRTGYTRAIHSTVMANTPPGMLLMRSKSHHTSYSMTL